MSHADRLRLGPGEGGHNTAKHRVTFEEAMTVFRDPHALSMLDDDPDEERWITLGVAPSENLLLVVHTWADIDADRSVVSIISARRPNRKEARQYREDSNP
ncbi:MAG: BrnT family toxin [Xanthobacteraceae bacterium]